VAGHGLNILFKKKKNHSIESIFSKSWNDYNLRWDPDEFGNITTLRVASSHIWIPGFINIIFIFSVKKINLKLKTLKIFLLVLTLSMQLHNKQGHLRIIEF